MSPSDFHFLHLSQLFYSSSRLLIQRIQIALNEFGMTYLQYLVMSVLWQKDCLKVHELGKELDLDSGTLTPLLKKLESQHLIKRKRGKSDERTVSIHLTYPGKTLQSKTLEALQVLENQLAQNLGKSTEKLVPQVEVLLEKLKTHKK
jgi:MarR family transcriptional regulator, organic hydroperoxide resistance regulator